LDTAMDARLARVGPDEMARLLARAREFAA
jgi:hypothetical protein